MERGIQGGMSVITHRLAQTNYKYLSEKYDTKLPDSYCVYLDANKLYGWGMSQYASM